MPDKAPAPDLKIDAHRLIRGDHKRVVRITIYGHDAITRVDMAPRAALDLAGLIISAAGHVNPRKGAVPASSGPRGTPGVSLRTCPECGRPEEPLGTIHHAPFCTQQTHPPTPGPAPPPPTGIPINHWTRGDSVFATLCGIDRIADLPDGDTVTFPLDTPTPAPPTCPDCLAELRHLLARRYGGRRT